MIDLILSAPTQLLSDGNESMSDLTERKQNLTPLQKSYNYCRDMPTFRLGRNVRDNIKALRSALGSATRELSRDDLARLINEATNRGVTGSTIRWWEKGRGQPDIQTIVVMARLAGVSFEQFALGAGAGDDQLELPDPTKDRKLTAEEIQRAHRQAQIDRSERQRRERGIGGAKRGPRRGKD